ncbi:arginine--tRNA ligase [Candidatus Gracilibacteria bacterium]|nr:arginine--tRNA ligase [Candidatus Gracilibacteria bacterium]NUJ99447.1 arginine--tRNA ligase [Candidatus Gracilibacteria bacterium]
MKQQIIGELKKIIQELYNLDFSEISLDTPPKKELGDFAFPCFLLAKELKKSPQMIASEIKEYREQSNNLSNIFSQVTPAGAYLNISLSPSFLTKVFFENLENQNIFANFPKKNETIVVDYIGTNVGKPLHIGHMCTPNIGQTLVNLYEKLGYNVIGDSHIGDWGIIFGKLILAYKLWGDREELEKNAVKYLFDLYVKITNEIEKDISRYKFFIVLYKETIDKKFTNYSSFSNKEKNILKDIDELQKNINLESFLLLKNIVDGISFDEYTDDLKNLLSTNIRFQNLEQQTRDEFKKLSEGNPESVELWKEFTSYSIKSMQTELDRLHVKADYNIGESFYEGIGIPKLGNYPDIQFTMKDIVKELIQKGIATQNDDGSVGIIFPEETKLPSCILQKRDGTHGYFASDLATIKYRTENSKKKRQGAGEKSWENLKKIICCADVRQELHLKQVSYTTKKAGWLENSVIPAKAGIDKNYENQKEIEFFHAANGFISLKDGAMSTRTGKIIPLKDLLDEAEVRAEKIILEKRQDIQGLELAKLKKIIGIGAIKYGYLSKSRLTNVVFDWDEFMTFEGNSAPYIQYAYVRGKSILAQANFEKKEKSFGKNSFEEKEEIELIKELFNYRDILIQSAKENMPHIIANYAYELTKKFGSFYNACHILSEKDEQKKYMRLQLVETFCKILKDTFDILAIEMPEKM